MNKVLKDPIAPKKKEAGKYPFGFEAPSYDNRTSCSMSGGDDYGIGHRVPVGKETASSIESGPIPQQSHCFSSDEVIYDQDKKG